MQIRFNCWISWWSLHFIWGSYRTWYLIFFFAGLIGELKLFKISKIVILDWFLWIFLKSSNVRVLKAHEFSSIRLMIPGVIIIFWKLLYSWIMVFIATPKSLLSLWFRILLYNPQCLRIFQLNRLYCHS